MNLRQFSSVSSRKKAVEQLTNISFKNIGHYSLNEKIASKRNCENMIGVAQIPLGVAGPLSVKRLASSVKKKYYIPLATTEGALVASVNRGCKAITESGGAIINSQRIGATRGPVFYTGGIINNEKFYLWIKTHKIDLQKVAVKTSRHLTLEKFDIKTIGKYSYVRFYFDTQDAMGMNMVTIATEKMAEFIEKETDVRCLSLSGNFCVDKKPSWQNFINNRGIKVWAEVTIPNEVLQKTLKTTAQKVYDVWLAKCMIGSVMSGSMGFNAQYANIIAAIFLATGQDIAHVVEGSLGITTTEVTNEDLYISVYLPDLMVGTVGGGTGLETQKEALELLGVAGGSTGKNSQQFAEIIGAAVLAGEISLLASLSEGSLTKAHQKLGRGEK